MVIYHQSINMVSDQTQHRQYGRKELFTLDRVRKLRTSINLTLPNIKKYIPVVGTKGKTSLILLITSFIKKEIPNGVFVWPPLPMPASLYSNTALSQQPLHSCILINNEFIPEEEWNQAYSTCSEGDPFQLCTVYEKAFLTALTIFNAKRIPLILVESAIGGCGDACSLITELMSSDDQICTILTKVDGDRRALLLESNGCTTCGIVNTEMSNNEADCTSLISCYLSILTKKLLTMEKSSSIPKEYTHCVEDLPITMGSDWRHWIRGLDLLAKDGYGGSYKSEMINFAIKIYQYLCAECSFPSRNGKGGCVPRFPSLFYDKGVVGRSFKLGNNVIVTDPSDSCLSSSLSSLEIGGGIDDICLVLGISNARTGVQEFVLSLIDLFSGGSDQRKKMEINFVSFAKERPNCPFWIKPLDRKIEFKERSEWIKRGHYGSIEDVLTAVMKKKETPKATTTMIIITGSSYIVEDFYKML